MSENKMPWDTPSDSQLITRNDYVSQEARASDPKSKATDDDLKEKYGIGKPRRVFIRGDIKSGSDK